MEQRRRNFREFDDIYRKYGKRFRFPVYLGEEFMETPLDNLELSVRSYNCLWRAGIRNVGNIVNRIDNRTDLLHIRNLGIPAIFILIIGHCATFTFFPDPAIPAGGQRQDGKGNQN